MTVAPLLNGRRYVETDPSDGGATIFALQNGDRVIRQPASLRPLLDKLASGAAFPLSDEERGFVRGMGVELIDVTTEALQTDAFAMLAAGTDRDGVNAFMAAKTAQAQYKTKEPVKFITALKPAY